jgi:hypothetical protein
MFLIRNMHDAGLPVKLMRLVRVTLKHAEVQVNVHTQLTEPLKIRQGLKQGDGLAPALFNLALEFIIRKLSVNAKGTAEYTAQVIGYADYVCLVSRNVRTIKYVYHGFTEAAVGFGLNRNTSKTKAMIMSHSEVNTDLSLNVGGHNTELVNSFVYLGSCVTDDKSELSEIQSRLILANNAYCSLIAVMKNRMVCKFVKIRLYKTLIRTVFTYGCGTWKLFKKKKSR